MKTLVAFVMACFAVGLGFTLLMAVELGLGRLTRRPPETPSAFIEVSSSQSPDKVVSAIKALNLPNVHVHGHATQLTWAGFAVMPFELTLYFFIFGGLVFVVFKRICRWMGIEPIV